MIRSRSLPALTAVCACSLVSWTSIPTPAQITDDSDPPRAAGVELITSADQVESSRPVQDPIVWSDDRLRFSPACGRLIADLISFPGGDPVELIVDQWHWNETDAATTFSLGSHHHLRAGGERVLDIDTVNLQGTGDAARLSVTADRINLWNRRGDLSELMADLSLTVLGPEGKSDGPGEITLRIGQFQTARIWNEGRDGELTSDTVADNLVLSLTARSETDLDLRLDLATLGGRITPGRSAGAPPLHWSLGPFTIRSTSVADDTGHSDGANPLMDGQLHLANLDIQAPGALRVAIDHLRVETDPKGQGFLQMQGLTLSPALQARLLPFSGLGPMDLEVRFSQLGDTDNLRDQRVAIETLRFQSGAGLISLTGTAGLEGFTITGEASGLRAMLRDAGVATPEAADLLLALLRLGQPDARDRIPLEFTVSGFDFADLTDVADSDDLFDDDILWESFPCRPRSWDPPAIPPPADS